MVQEFNVLRCFSCSVYQVDQVKKTTKKWSCKMCGEKQSIKQIFYTGTSKDSRMRVQMLNFQKREQTSSVAERINHFQLDDSNLGLERENVSPCMIFQDTSPQLRMAGDKWEKFIKKNEDIEVEEEETISMTLDRKQFKESQKMARERSCCANRDKIKPYRFPQDKNKEEHRAKPTAEERTSTNFHQNNLSPVSFAKGNSLSTKETQTTGYSKWGQYLTLAAKINGDSSESSDDTI